MWPPGRGEYTCRRAMCVYVCIEKLTSRCPDDYLKASVIHLTSQLDESVPLIAREYLWTTPPPSTPSGLFIGLLPSSQTQRWASHWIAHNLHTLNHHDARG